MDVIRTIHPVGQGGFYTETFKDDNDEQHTIVYDCGGSSQASMNQYLKKFLHSDDAGGKMRIDAVFISHLHSDHINGLEYLLKNADVKYLILPQLTEAMMLEALVYNRVRSFRDSKQINSLVLNLYGEDDHYGSTKVIKVDFAAPEERISLEQEGNEVDLLGEINVNCVKAKTLFHFRSQPLWVYIPYNPPANRKQVFEAFIKAIRPFTGSSIADAPRLINSHVEDCKAIYEKYFGTNHNSYSMTVFSGIINSSSVNLRWEYGYHYGFVWYHSPSCLFTGDFEPNSFMSGIKEYYAPFWESIGVIQVPHHGSRLNYHPDLYKVPCLSFVSVGEKNSYDHPSIDTLINIQSQDCCPLVVTNNMSSIILLHYRLWDDE